MNSENWQVLGWNTNYHNKYLEPLFLATSFNLTQHLFVLIISSHKSWDNSMSVTDKWINGLVSNEGISMESLTLWFLFFSSTSLLLPTHLPPPSCTHAQECNPMDFSPPDSSVHGFFQARILEWVAISFSMTLWFYLEEPKEISLIFLHKSS